MTPDERRQLDEDGFVLVDKGDVFQQAVAWPAPLEYVRYVLGPDIN